MATATKTTKSVTETVKVDKLKVMLELDEDEAKMLRTVLGYTGGQVMQFGQPLYKVWKALIAANVDTVRVKNLTQDQWGSGIFPEFHAADDPQLKAGKLNASVWTFDRYKKYLP